MNPQRNSTISLKKIKYGERKLEAIVLNNMKMDILFELLLQNASKCDHNFSIIIEEINKSENTKILFKRIEETMDRLEILASTQ